MPPNPEDSFVEADPIDCIDYDESVEDATDPNILQTMTNEEMMN